MYPQCLLEYLEEKRQNIYDLLCLTMTDVWHQVNKNIVYVSSDLRYWYRIAHKTLWYRTYQTSETLIFIFIGCIMKIF